MRFVCLIPSHRVWIGIGFLILATCNVPKEGTMPVSPVLQEHGILYVRSEYEQRPGVSIYEAAQPGGAPERWFTTTYEFWIDPGNPWRFRRVTTEWLPDGPHIRDGMGSDGETGWWELDVARGITVPVYHSGRPPQSNARWLETFTVRPAVLRLLQPETAERLQEEERAPWGRVETWRYRPAPGAPWITITVRVEEPRIRVQEESPNALGETNRLRIVEWRWLEEGALPPDFWLRPPEPPIPPQEQPGSSRSLPIFPLGDFRGRAGGLIPGLF